VPLDVRVHGAAVRVSVHVQPRAARSELVGMHGTALKVRLSAPPVDGAANDALVDLLALRFGIARRAVRIVSGQAARTKVVELTGVTVADVRAVAGDD
jgi:uncharacterized protein